jgi:hypothetical protein
LVGSPVHPIFKSLINYVLFSADYEQHTVPNCRGVEPINESGGSLTVLNPEDPVDELTESVLEAARPLRREFGGVVEDALLVRVLEFDEAVLVIYRVADREVRYVVTEDVKLAGETDLLIVDNIWVVGAHERAEMWAALKKGQNVLRFGKIGLVRVVQKRFERL